jgi:hypothetical protein
MSKANAISFKPTLFMCPKEEPMTKMNHLHTSLTEPLSVYRQCDVQTLVGQIPDRVFELVSGSLYKRVVSVNAEGEYTPVGVLLPIDEKNAVRVLYTYFDLYEVQRIVIDGDAMTIEEAWDGIFADQLGFMISSAASAVAHQKLA